MNDENFEKYLLKKNGVIYAIEEDLVGWYLIVYKDNTSSMDFLFDTLEDAFFEAEERFGIKKTEWKKDSTNVQN